MTAKAKGLNFVGIIGVIEADLSQGTDMVGGLSNHVETAGLFAGLTEGSLF
jgi:hypothetical protein